MNPTVEQLAIPYQRAMTFLSYIRGPLVDDWVDEQCYDRAKDTYLMVMTTGVSGN